MTEVSGSFILEEQADNTSLGIFDLDINMDAPSLSTFRRLLVAKTLPDLKPVKASAHLTGTTEKLSLEDLTIQAGYSGSVRFALNGRIGNLILDSDKPVQEVDVIGSFYAESTSLLSQYAGIELPDLGPIEGTWKLVERTGGYGSEESKWVIGDQDKGWFHGAGSVEYVMRGTDVAFEGIDLSFEVKDFNSNIIADHLNKRHLDIGRINGRMSVSGSPQDLAVSGIEFLSVSPEGLKASIRGGAQHIRPEEDIPLQGIDMELAVEISDMKALQKVTELDLPDMSPLNISARVNDRSGTLDVETFQVRAGPEDQVTLLIDGRMNDIFSSEKMDFFVAFEASTKPWLEDFYGHTVPEDHRIKGETALTGSRDHFTIKGSVNSGETHITTMIEILQKEERQNIAVTVSAPKIYLDDLGIYPEIRKRKDPAKKEKKVHYGKIFSEEPYPFPSFKNLDVSFQLDTEEVIGKDFTLNDLDIDIVLDKGLLLIGPAKLNYADGFVALESSLDTRGDNPEMKVKVTAEDIEVSDLLAYVHSPLLLKGHLNMAADLQSTGISPREIASTLNGEFGIAVENGQIKKLADLLGADAIDFVTTVRKVGKYQRLNCLALHFNFDKGIGESQVIYVDTPSVRSIGKGTMNLRDEKIDLVIQPKPKRGQLGGSSAVTIKGPLNRPSASKMPFKEAARLYGEIFMPYVFLPARAAGYVWSLMKNDTDEASPCLSPASQPEEKGE
jgi:hypothetical protein